MWLALIAVVCAGCAEAPSDRGSGPSAAGSATHVSREVAAVEKICRWSIDNSLYRTHTTPGSYVTRPPGSCPHLELAAAVALADGLKSGGAQGTGVCKLLVSDALRNAQRVAADTHVSCGKAAIEPGQTGSVPAARRFSHLAAVLLGSSSPGPPHWYGFLEFAPAGWESHPRDPRYTSVIVAITKVTTGRWAIAQIGYEF
jgi:hypothetical protein